MKVSVTSEFRFTQLPDGSVWTETAFPYAYWKRYLQIFDEVRIVARVKMSDSIPPLSKRVDGERVSLCALSDYTGPFAYFLARKQLRHEIETELSVRGAIILTVPSPIALIAEKMIQKLSLPYGVEVMGDPWEVFSSTGIQHPLRVFFRHRLTRSTRRQIFGASAVSYVTQKTLQRSYPASASALSVGVSNIDLLPEHLAFEARRFDANPEIKMISVGSLEQLYKSPEIVLQAIAKGIKAGLRIQLTWIGGGKFLPEMIQLSETLGIASHTQFLGQLSSGDEVRRELDRANLFILASKTEGLPRALIEAMARALPCIGSNVGGIPELLEADELFAPNDPDALLKKLNEVSQSAERLQSMSKRNLEKSTSFLKEKLDQRRLEFLKHLREQTESVSK